MKVVLVTGSGGLIGSEAVSFYLSKGFRVVGVDNNMREVFFGSRGSVMPIIAKLKNSKNYTHEFVDIRDSRLVSETVKKHKPDVLIHCAAQPSHDKAADIPLLDFDVNARGTLNLLESCRIHVP